MHRLLSDLGITLPVLAAPMAGGPSTPALVTEAARAGGLGFLAAGYRSPDSLAGQIAEVRAAGVPFGVNLFAPNPVPVDPDAFRRYADELHPEAERLGVDLPQSDPIEDDDGWQDKLDLLLSDPVPLVSFTFGIPEPSVVTALRRAGSAVAQTVTSVDEARQAAEAGADLLVVQAAAAGGHSGTTTPAEPPPALPLPTLVASVREAVGLPVIGAGGVSTADEVAAVVRAGADAAMVGTALLRTEESGTSDVHRAALAEGGRDTVVTRAFTGRPARALRNAFTDRLAPSAPLGYPAVHHLTGPVRKAAAAAGDVEWVHLWAGTGYRNARAEPAAAALRRLGPA